MKRWVVVGDYWLRIMVIIALVWTSLPLGVSLAAPPAQGGEGTPTATVSPTVSLTPGASATLEATAAISETATVEPTATVEATAVVSETATAEPTATLEATPIISETATVEPTVTATEIISETATPTETATVEPTPTVTVTTTITPTETATPPPSPTPTVEPTLTPTPVSSGTLTIGLISPQGGRVAVAGERLALDFAPGAVTQDLEIWLRHPDFSQGALPPPEQGQPLANFNFTAHQPGSEVELPVQFQAPVTVTYTYLPAEVEEMLEETLHFVYLNPETESLEPISSTVHLATGRAGRFWPKTDPAIQQRDRQRLGRRGRAGHGLAGQWLVAGPGPTDPGQPDPQRGQRRADQRGRSLDAVSYQTSDLYEGRALRPESGQPQPGLSGGAGRRLLLDCDRPGRDALLLRHAAGGGQRGHPGLYQSDQ